MGYCEHCGAEIPDEAKFCPGCGTPVQGAAELEPDPGSQMEIAPVEEPAAAGRGAVIASLVLGIVGVIFWFFGCGSLLSIILGIIGLVLAGSARRAGNTEGIRTAGVVLSIAALVGGVIVFLYLVTVIAFLGVAAKSVSDYLR